MATYGESEARDGFSPGDMVRVDPRAPMHGGLVGEVVDSECRGLLFGHWIAPDDGSEMVWVPIAALDMVKAVDRR